MQKARSQNKGFAERMRVVLECAATGLLGRCNFPFFIIPTSQLTVRRGPVAPVSSSEPELACTALAACLLFRLCDSSILIIPLIFPTSTVCLGVSICNVAKAKPRRCCRETVNCIPHTRGCGPKQPPQDVVDCEETHAPEDELRVVLGQTCLFIFITHSKAPSEECENKRYHP